MEAKEECWHECPYLHMPKLCFRVWGLGPPLCYSMLMACVDNQARHNNTAILTLSSLLATYAELAL